MKEIFDLVLYQPLLNILIFLYNFLPLHDLGISVIVLTLLIRAILSPLSISAFKTQKALAEIQPKIKEIKEKYKGNVQKQNQEVFKIYKEHRANPFSGCLPILIQLPIFIALFQILRGFNDPSQLFSDLYSFVRNPGELNTSFLGVMDLARENKIAAVLAGAFQFIQSKMVSSLTNQKGSASKKGQADQMSQIMAKQMTYMMPFFIVFIYWKLPSVLSLYWIIFTLFSIGEQYYINKKMKHAQ